MVSPRKKEIDYEEIFSLVARYSSIRISRKLDVEFEMKDLGMMHYFLGMEVWQNAEGIFLGQWKYAVEILKRFRMMGCKAITTPMESNLKLLSDASSEVVDSTIYR